MTHHPHDAAESWSICRRAFIHQAAHVAELGIIPRVIDWIIARGFSSSLYGSISLDNLVISDAADWRPQSQKVVVMPKPSIVELRLYTGRKLIEKIELSPDRVYEELDRLIPKLLRQGSTP